MIKKLLLLLCCCTATRAVNTVYTPTINSDNESLTKMVIDPLTKSGACPSLSGRVDAEWMVEQAQIAKEQQLQARAGNIVTTAKQHLGKRYRFGHRGPNTFDCSGFTSYIYEQEGIKIGRSSRDQFLEGETVALKDLQQGDLVFFGRGGSKHAINHVGIVTSVDSSKGKFDFIHACNRGVSIDTYPDETYYMKRYVSARRILTH